MNYVKKYLLIVLTFFALVSSYANADICVDKNMLLWEPGYNYSTEFVLRLKIDGVKFNATADERLVKGNIPPIAHYYGNMRFETSLCKDSSNYQGSAIRHYFTSEIRNTYGDGDFPDIKFDIYAKGWWDGLKIRCFDLLPEWLGGASSYEVTDSREEDGVRIITAKLSKKIVDERTKPIEMAFQFIKALSDKTYKLSWKKKLVNDEGKCSLNVKTSDGKAVASKYLTEAIERESAMLYSAVTSGVARKPGDVWVINGETLRAIIQPGIGAELKGIVVVKAEELVNAEQKFPGNSFVNGIKLKFISTGKVDGITRRSDLTLCFKLSKDNEGELSGEVKFDFDNYNTLGELWLDNVNKIVAYGILKTDDTSYNGRMPQLGKLVKDFECNGYMSLNLTYGQVKTLKK